MSWSIGLSALRRHPARFLVDVESKMHPFQPRLMQVDLRARRE